VRRGRDARGGEGENVSVGRSGEGRDKSSESPAEENKLGLFKKKRRGDLSLEGAGKRTSRAAWGKEEYTRQVNT